MPIALKLTVYRGSELVSDQAFTRDIVKIGRLASAHLKLDDAKVSRIHAVIEATGDGQGYSIIDMGSTEGTFLNGDKISKERLKDGDELRLGDTKIVVFFEDVGRDDALPVAASAVLSAVPISSEAQQVVQAAPPAPQAQELWAASIPELGQAEPTQASAPAGVLLGGPTMVTAAPVMPEAGAYAAVVPQQTPVLPPEAAAPWSQVPGYAPAPEGYAAVPEGYPQPMAEGYAHQAPEGYPGTGAQWQAYGESGFPIPPPAAPTLPPGIPMPAHAHPYGAWGAVPNNLASEGVPDGERALEIKTLWGSSVLDTLTVHDKPRITLGDERKIAGWGPFQRVEHCDIEIPSRDLPSKSWALADHAGGDGTSYTLHLPPGLTGRVERADGHIISLEALYQGGQGAETGDVPGSVRYPLRAAETVFVAVEQVVLQIRYVRRTQLVPPPFMSRLNYAWVNTLVLAFFFHAMAIVSFVATPQTQAQLNEDLFKNPTRFANFKLTPEQKQKQDSMLSKLKQGETGAKAKGADGKAGKKDHDKSKKDGRMAVKGDPTQQEIAKSTLNTLFGAKGGDARSHLFGSGGLGGELKGALGGVTGAEIGDAAGLGGLGTRGSGPGGGGLSMNSVGLGALGTHGRGGGQGGTGYGEGAAGLGRKDDRDLNISAGSPIIMGSLDKELIRRVIKQHLPQIRYCYEKELIRSPGLFGKVATEFTITAEGAVSDAKVSQSTLNNDEVERCITAKIRTWRFPKPKGGGVVVVKYPFLFKTTG